MSFKFHSKIPKTLDEWEHNYNRALKAVGEYVEGTTKMNAPVDLGNLRGSITHEVDMSTKSVHIGTNVEYGIYQEFGTGKYAENGNGRKTPWMYEDPKTGEVIFTSGNKPQPFLRPAAEDNKKPIVNLFQHYLTRGFKK